ncbi:MAG: type II toxin-antitoxin system ParD family antitoxin, partial [Candidatus Binatia bacterium]
MTISLPEPMREFIESEVAKGDYGSASELFREMVRDRQKRNAQERLEMLLLEGLESGDPIAVNADSLSRRR